MYSPIMCSNQVKPVVFSKTYAQVCY